MAKPPSRIADIADFLSDGTGTAKEKLRIGGKMLAAALILPNDWPPALVATAAKLKASLCNGRKLEKAVEEMSDTAARTCLKQFSRRHGEPGERDRTGERTRADAAASDRARRLPEVPASRLVPSFRAT